jgi:hypothetical protein
LIIFSQEIMHYSFSSGDWNMRIDLINAVQEIIFALLMTILIESLVFFRIGDNLSLASFIIFGKIEYKSIHYLKKRLFASSYWSF